VDHGTVEITDHEDIIGGINPDSPKCGSGYLKLPGWFSGIDRGFKRGCLILTAGGPQSQTQQQNYWKSFEDSQAYTLFSSPNVTSNRA
jgi:hypothetical protein